MQKMDFIVFVCTAHVECAIPMKFSAFFFRSACQCQLLHSKLLLAPLNFRIDFWSSFFFQVGNEYVRLRFKYEPKILHIGFFEKDSGHPYVKQRKSST